MFPWIAVHKLITSFKEYFITFYNLDCASIEIFLTSPSCLSGILASKFPFLLQSGCSTRAGEKLPLKHFFLYPVFAFVSHLEIKTDAHRIIFANAAVTQFERWQTGTQCSYLWNKGWQKSFCISRFSDSVSEVRSTLDQKRGEKKQKDGKREKRHLKQYCVNIVE